MNTINFFLRGRGNKQQIADDLLKVAEIIRNLPEDKLNNYFRETGGGYRRKEGVLDYDYHSDKPTQNDQ